MSSVEIVNHFLQLLETSALFWAVWTPLFVSFLFVFFAELDFREGAFTIFAADLSLEAHSGCLELWQWMF